MGQYWLLVNGSTRQIRQGPQTKFPNCELSELIDLLLETRPPSDQDLIDNSREGREALRRLVKNDIEANEVDTLEPRLSGTDCLAKLPAEIQREIFNQLACQDDSYCDLVSLALTCRRFFAMWRRHFSVMIMHRYGAWSGHRLVNIGDYYDGRGLKLLNIDEESQVDSEGKRISLGEYVDGHFQHIDRFSLPKAGNAALIEIGLLLEKGKINEALANQMLAMARPVRSLLFPRREEWALCFTDWKKYLLSSKMCPTGKCHSARLIDETWGVGILGGLCLTDDPSGMPDGANGRAELSDTGLKIVRSSCVVNKADWHECDFEELLQSHVEGCLCE